MNNPDVLLLLEGTYPYVRGGVSSWVHQMIQGLPQYKFGIVYIGGEKSQSEKMQYQLPDNIVHFEEHFLQKSWEKKKSVPSVGNPDAFNHCWHVHKAFKDKNVPLPEEDLGTLLNMLNDKKNGVSLDDFLFSENSWNFITRAYEEYSKEPSFINYFWTIRSMHAPIFMLKEVADRVPRAPIIHSVSTGYAGLLASLIKHKDPTTNFVLSEHGIYTKERKIDLAQADWLYDSNTSLTGSANPDFGYIRKLWVRFFEEISRICYTSADPIVALYEGNQQRQVKDGAEPSKTRLIPNGIPLQDYALQAGFDQNAPVIALIGRVVPIKDIKTFIRSMRTIANAKPAAQAWIVGPEEEDVEYAQECRELISSLGLSDVVLFKGFRNVQELLPSIQLLVLTSISEAQPLVLLEAMASGVPQVTTDVGSCRELIEGGDQEDRDLGATGLCVNISNASATATACLSLLEDQSVWHAAQQVGLKRVKKYYSESLMFQRYESIYSQFFDKGLN